MRIKRPANLRSIALPIEHGGWGFLLEPILLGLIIVPSFIGLSFAFAMLAFFLIHQPLKVAVKDRFRGTRVLRTRWAEGFVLLYGCLALIFAIPALLSGSTAFFVAIALMLPFIAVQTFYDFRNDSRALLPELSGAIALSVSAAAIAMLGGWKFMPAMILSALLIARSIPAILFVRSYLRKVRGKATSATWTYLAHLVAIVFVVGLALSGYSPWLSVVAMVVLLIRAFMTLSSSDAIPPKTLGFREMGFGFVTVILIAVGFLLDF